MSRRGAAARHPGLAALAALAFLGAASGAPALSCLSATVTATGPAFGTYNPLNVANTWSNGSVQVTCYISTAINATVSASVALNAGSSGSFTPRTLQAGGHALNYNLYADSAYTQVWGDGTGSTVTVTDSFTFVLLGGLVQSVTSTVYGQIPAQQLAVYPGNYTDTITVTVNY
jgi:spore coat protein U-like protein